jgi:hypothetical protein
MGQKREKKNRLQIPFEHLVTAQAGTFLVFYCVVSRQNERMAE